MGLLSGDWGTRLGKGMLGAADIVGDMAKTSYLAEAEEKKLEHLRKQGNLAHTRALGIADTRMKHDKDLLDLRHAHETDKAKTLATATSAAQSIEDRLTFIKTNIESYDKSINETTKQMNDLEKSLLGSNLAMNPPDTYITQRQFLQDRLTGLNSSRNMALSIMDQMTDPNFSMEDVPDEIIMDSYIRKAAEVSKTGIIDAIEQGNLLEEEWTSSIQGYIDQYNKTLSAAGIDTLDEEQSEEFRTVVSELVSAAIRDKGYSDAALDTIEEPVTDTDDKTKEDEDTDARVPWYYQAFSEAVDLEGAREASAQKRLENIEASKIQSDKIVHFLTDTKEERRVRLIEENISKLSEEGSKFWNSFLSSEQDIEKGIGLSILKQQFESLSKADKKIIRKISPNLMEKLAAIDVSMQETPNVEDSIAMMFNASKSV